MSRLQLPGAVQKRFPALPVQALTVCLFNAHKSPRGGLYCCSHFTKEQREARRCERRYPRATRLPRSKASVRFQSGQSEPERGATALCGRSGETRGGDGGGAGAGRGATLSLRRPEKCCLRSWKCRWPGTQAAPSWHGTGARTAAPPAPSGGGLQAEPPSPSEQRDVAAARCHSCRGGEQKYFGCNFILLSCCASALIHSPRQGRVC